MEKIDMTFVRNIESKLEDCTTPLQFREVMEKFKAYLYNGQIIKIFQGRLEVIATLKNSTFNNEIFESIEEELEGYVTDKCDYSFGHTEVKRSTKGRKKDKPLLPESTLSINLKFDSCEGSLMIDAKKAVIKVAMEKALGKKKEVCRLLGIPASELEDCLSFQDVKIHARRVKQHVKSQVLKKKI